MNDSSRAFRCAIRTVLRAASLMPFSSARGYACTSRILENTVQNVLSRIPFGTVFLTSDL
jgi:hypothetical protein